MATKPENKPSAAAPPAVALSEPVDAIAKSKMAAQTVAGNLARTDAGLQYRILRRDANGVFTEAPADTEFDAGDALRVRVEAPSAGILSLSAGGELLASLAVEANQVYVLPGDRPITVDAGSLETRLTLALSPPRAERREMREKKAAASAAGSGSARPALSVEIVLRHR